ncbi:hypothetical protein [Streptomyces sp. NPDC006274]
MRTLRALAIVVTAAALLAACNNAGAAVPAPSPQTAPVPPEAR